MRMVLRFERISFCIIHLSLYPLVSCIITEIFFFFAPRFDPPFPFIPFIPTLPHYMMAPNRGNRGASRRASTLPTRRSDRLNTRLAGAAQDVAPPVTSHHDAFDRSSSIAQLVDAGGPLSIADNEPLTTQVDGSSHLSTDIERVDHAPDSTSTHTSPPPTHATSTTTTHPTIYSHLVNTLASLAPGPGIVPRSVAEAIWLHQNPKCLSEASRPTPGSRERGRPSLAPPHPDGQSRSSTDKRLLLQKIMENDPELRANGITIECDERMLFRLDEELRTKMRADLINDHRNARSDSVLPHLILATINAQLFLSRETLTNEAVTTGVFRMALYALANMVTQDKTLFSDPKQDNGEWGDGSTTKASNPDTGCWFGNRCGCGGEHKRPKVCTEGDLESLERQVQTPLPEGGRSVIKITLGPSGLQFAYRNYMSPDRETHLNKLLSQVSTTTTEDLAQITP